MCFVLSLPLKSWASLWQTSGCDNRKSISVEMLRVPRQNITSTSQTCHRPQKIATTLVQCRQPMSPRKPVHDLFLGGGGVTKYLINSSSTTSSFALFLPPIQGTASIFYLTLDVIETECPVVLRKNWTTCESRPFYGIPASTRHFLIFALWLALIKAFFLFSNVFLCPSLWQLQ